MRSHLATVLDALAAPRAGVISTALLVRAGFDPELPSREVAARRWQRLLPSIYLTSGEPPTLEQRCQAAILHGGRRSLITGNAGCLLHGIRGARTDEPVVHLLLPHGVRRVSSDFCHVVRTRHLPRAEQVVAASGTVMAVAGKALCVADALRTSPDLSAARAADCAALRDPQVNWDLVMRQAARPGPGAGHCRRTC